MKLKRIKAIADTVLYEGYILYPYRPSSIKNRQRWTFGSVFPRAFAGCQGDSATMQTQLLLRADDHAAIDVSVRFLQILTREVGALPRPVADPCEAAEAQLALLSRLEVDGKEYLAWEEAIEREIAVRDISVAELARVPRKVAFRFDDTQSREPILNTNNETVGFFIRSSSAIEGTIKVEAERLACGVCRVTVRIENITPFSIAGCNDRNLAQRCAFASTHTILKVRDGAFVSLMDPPEYLRDASANCDNQGTWPVLVGNAGDTDAMLSSPIILYDHPDIAPESPGDLFDGTEIDEILTLRILAMTDAEKREMASTDTRARALLERTHGLTAGDLALMHGAMRPAHEVRCTADSLVGGSAAEARPRLVSLLNRGGDLSVGSQVRLRPKAGGDILDLALKDKIAIVEAIERDFEDRIHVAVTLVDDPGRDLGAAGFPGHRFYFSREEIEPIGDRP